MMWILRTGLVATLLVTASACGSTESSTPETVPPSAPTTSMTADVSTPTSDAPAPTTTPTTPTTTPTTTPATEPAIPTVPTETTAPSPTVPASIVDVKIYLLREERLVIAHREVPGPAVLRGALEALLAGPSDDEASDGLFSIVPAGTELLDVNLADGQATVDLSSQYESGGGSLSMLARIAQVVFTATQFDNVDRVLFWLDGEPIDFLGGEGIVLDEPMARMHVERSLTGGVIVDTPAPGATVGSPFTVTGEGDVFEAQFPIEVWANGEQIGGVAPVTAGAWGEWADFEATITLDAPPGPIELIAYDPGGCGTGPECPEIVKTIVPLTFSTG